MVRNESGPARPLPCRGAALIVLLMNTAALGAATAEPGPDAVGVTPRDRPRIGLVLGGGGAKGAAHVGVLTVLEQMRIPVDCVIGTSMGALVGGIYASGVGASDLESAVRSISWQETIAFRGKRDHVPMRSKLAGVTYSNSFELGLKGRRVTAPSGFFDTQNVEQTIQRLISRSHGIKDFDRLPIQYRAVATDMQRGEMVVLSSGNLAQAMRASMAVPGVFSPVIIDGRVLGDGGLSRNLAVDVARDTCADVVIAVAVPDPVPTLEDLQSPLTQVARTLDVLIGANEKQQLATLGPADVGIVVELEGIGSASFDRIDEAIPIGRKAALAQREPLVRYSLGEADYRAWRDSVSRSERGPVRVAAVTMEGLERVNEEYVREVARLSPGDVLTQAQIAARVDALYALGDFEYVRYGLRGDPDSPTLELSFKEKSWGPDFVRFDVGFYMGTDETSAFTIGGDFHRTWINSLGGELAASLRFGRTAGLEAALYQPLDRAHRWFVEPGVSVRRSVEDYFLDGDAIARYTLSHAWAYLDAGRVFGNHAELRAGIRAGAQWADRDIAVPELEEISGEGYGGLTLGFVYDTRDREVLAQSGLLTRLDYFRGEESLGAIGNYDRLEGMILYAVPVGEDVFHLRATGGSSFDTRLPVYDTFTLGGPASFPGLSIGELRGSSYWTAQALYLHKVADISDVFGQALYAGFALTAGDMSGRIDLVRDDTLYSGALILGGRTPLGPLSMSLAAASSGDWQVVLGLGRPVEERNILDPSW